MKPGGSSRKAFSPRYVATRGKLVFGLLTGANNPEKQSKRSFSQQGFLIIINGILIAFSVIVALALSAPKGNGVAAWLTLAALLFSNAIFHIIGAIQTKRYSPGMISGIVLYIPLAIYGFAHFLRSGQASVGTALLAFAIGGSYHFISFANHRRRALATRAE